MAIFLGTGLQWTLNFQPQTRKNEAKLPRPARPTANDQNHTPMGCLGQGGVNGPQPHTAPGGFVLEGAWGDNMATWKCVSIHVRFVLVVWHRWASLPRPAAWAPSWLRNGIPTDSFGVARMKSLGRTLADG